MRKIVISAVLLALVALAVGGYFMSNRAVRPTGQAMALAVDAQPLVAETSGGERSFSIEVADDPVEREQGLMFRESMADDHGMLFVFERPQIASFWMKNTPMPLDLLFVGQDGRVRSIKHGEPFSEAVIASNEPVRFVLELKAGTSKAVGISNGDMLRHPAINEASVPGSGG